MSNYRKKKRSSADGEKRQCVLYLRVSTASQTYTARDISKDGNSIAVQREETMAKANELGLVVAKEFVEPGRSAQTMEKRPVFRQMLAYVSEHPEVGAIIVYSRSRAFRNVEDAMLTRRNLRMLGVKLISTKEDFGDSFEGDAMATITDAMNELQYRLNGQDVKLKMAHKAKNGGTITRAPIGYLNTRITVEGHLVNSIGIDEERAPLVRLMFELYATGEYSIPQLTAVMQDQGLEARPTGRHLTPRPITRDTVERVLGDPYYAGWIFYDGELYEGRHEALIDQELFDRVQDLLEARSGTGMHMQVHHHYLKGSLWCGRCDADGRRNRLIYMEVKGGQYAYFVCMGRYEHVCDLPYLRVEAIEDAVEQHYSELPLAEGYGEKLLNELEAGMEAHQRIQRDLVANLTRELSNLDEQADRLLHALMNGLAAEDKVRHLMNDIQLKRRGIEERIAKNEDHLTEGLELAKTWVALAQRPDYFYAQAGPDVRTQLNRGFFKRLVLDLDDGNARIRVTHELCEPLAGIYRTAAELADERARPTRVIQNMQEGRPMEDVLLKTSSLNLSDSRPRLEDVCSNMDHLVGVTGFEPAASSSRTKRATKLRHTPSAPPGGRCPRGH